MTRRQVHLDPEAPLLECEEKASAVSWPLPVDRRLDELLERLRRAGERTTRKELAAAIVFSCPTDAEDLSRALRAYRTATVADALVSDIPESGNVISIERHRPGPRARGS